MDLLAFALLGLTAGALYAGLGLVVVLQYRGSGVINFGAGAIAMFAAWVFYLLRTEGALLSPFPFPPGRIDLGGPFATVPAFIATMVMCALLGLLLNAALFSRLRTASTLAKLVASLGVLLTLQAVILLRFGPDGAPAPQILPDSIGTAFTIGSIPIPAGHFVIAGVVLIATGLLVALYRYTQLGIASRAVADNEIAAQLAGQSPNRVSGLTTVLACVLAGAVGVIVAPTTQLDATTIALAVIPALAAALLAGFTSFTIAAVAGLLMGMFEAVLLYLQTKSWFPTTGGLALPGVGALSYLVIVTTALVWRGRTLPVRGAAIEARLPPAPEMKHIWKPTLRLVGIAAVLLVVLPAELRQAGLNNIIFMVLCLSLVVTAGFLGQLSLLQLAIAGISAVMLLRLTVHAGIPFPLAPMLAVGCATAFGTLISLPALRVRGVHLAIVTLTAAVAIERFWFENLEWGARLNESAIPAPTVFGIDFGPSGSFPGWGGALPSPIFALSCLAVATLCALLVIYLRRSVVGKQMLAVRSNERAAAGAGIAVRNVKLSGMAVGSFLAGCAGVLIAYNLSSVSSARFGLLTSLALVAYAYIGGVTTVVGAIVGGLFAPEGIPSYVFAEYLGVPISYQLIITGIVLLINVVVFPAGLALAPIEKTFPPIIVVRWLWRLLLRPFRRSGRPAEPPATAGESPRAPATAPAIRDLVLPTERET